MIMSDGLRCLKLGGSIPALVEQNRDHLCSAAVLPCFLYDADTVLRQSRAALKAVGANADVYYAAKANGIRPMISATLSAGLGLDVSSEEELREALRVGCPPDRIILTGPGKSDEILRSAIAARVGLIAVESLREAARLSSIAAAVGIRQEVLLRTSPDIAPAFESANQPGFHSFAGKSVKFGFDEGQLQGVMPDLLGLSGIHIRGLHVFFASGVLDISAYREILRLSLELFERVSVDSGLPLDTLDLGGGWGLDFETGRTLDIADLEHTLLHLKSGRKRSPARLLFEPGTYVAGPSGVYCARIVDVKDSRGEIFGIVDGGFCDLLRAAIVGSHDITICDLGGREQPAACKRLVREIQIAGNSCHPLDVLCGRISVAIDALDELVDALVIVANCGAYGESFALRTFQGKARPKRYWYSNSDLKSI